METEMQLNPYFTLLRVKGDLRLWGNEEAETRVSEAIRQGLDQTQANLVLSLESVTNVDTAGIRSLVPVLKESIRRHINLQVVMPSSIAGQALRYIRIFEAWPKLDHEPTLVH